MMFADRDEVIRHLKIQNMVIQRQFNDRYTPGLHKALECTRDYARIRPVTLDEREVRILALAGFTEANLTLYYFRLRLGYLYKLSWQLQHQNTLPHQSCRQTTLYAKVKRLNPPPA